MDIVGRTAIVTGGARGFGRAITESLLARGARVAVFDIAPQPLAELIDQGQDIVPILCDVSDPLQVEEAVAGVFEQFGDVSVLINNAGIMKSAPLINIMKKGEERRHSISLWQKVIEVNLSSAFYMTSSVVDRLLARRESGVIVNISSISARGNSGQSAYAASKAGVEALTRVWAKELGPMKIRVGAVAPGFCDTAGASDALEKRYIDAWVGKTPLRRQGRIAEIVAAVLFIIDNDFFTGEILPINGGLVV